MASVYLNEEWLAGDTARISARDRGFRFGDGVFETIPFYASRPYQLHFHLARLEQGLAALRISPPPLDWPKLASELITRNNIADGFIRIAISRGEGSKGYRPIAGITPTVFAELIARDASAPKPASLWLSSLRKIASTALPAQKLAAHGAALTLSLLEAQDNGCDEALLLSASGHLSEAASGNLFWICNNQLYTPALSQDCLNGATRHALLRLIGAQEVIAPPEVLQSAEAVFITNCNWGILPVTQLMPYGWQWDAAHPIIAQCVVRYREDIHAPV